MIGTGILLLGGLGAWGAGRYCRDWANPVAVYTLVWSLTVALFFAEWVTYSPVHPRLWWALFLSATGFLLGGWSALLWGMPQNQGAVKKEIVVNNRSLEKLLVFFTILGGLGLILQINHLQATMGLKLLIEDPVTARRLHTNVPLWGYLNMLNVANIPLCLLLIKTSGRFRYWMIMTFLLAIGAAMLTTDRTRFFYMVIWSFFVWLYLHGDSLKIWHKLIGLICMVGSLLLFFILIGEHYDRKYSDRFPEHIQLTLNLQVLVDPYIYLTGSMAALDALLADENPMHMGKFSFSPLVSLARIIKPDIEMVPLQGKLYFVPMEINTYSYLQQFYQDFGWWGVLLGPYFCGWLSAWMYGCMRRKPSIWCIYVAGLLSFCCVMSVFVNTFTQEATWFFVLIGAVVQWWAGRKPSSREISVQEI